jgi:hypothetical protein
MSTVRATRCDYYYQHDFDSWRDQLGSLGMGGPNAVFINLAAVRFFLIYNTWAISMTTCFLYYYSWLVRDRIGRMR